MLVHVEKVLKILKKLPTKELKELYKKANKDIQNKAGNVSVIKLLVKEFGYTAVTPSLYEVRKYFKELGITLNKKDEYWLSKAEKYNIKHRNKTTSICQNCGVIFTKTKYSKFCLTCRNSVPRECSCGCGKIIYDPTRIYAVKCPTYKVMFNEQQKTSNIKTWSNTTLRNKQRENAYTYMNNEPPEKQKDRIEKAKKTKENKSEEEKKVWKRKIKETLLSKTEEEKEATIESYKQTMANKPQEEIDLKNKRISIANKKAWSNKKLREAQSKRAIERLNDPNDKFCKAGYGIKTIYKDTGILMRSTWEYRFAEDLENIVGIKINKINYEPSLSYKTVDGFTQWCRPDFFIPELQTYIEVRPVIRIDNKLLSKIKALHNIGIRIIIVTELNWSKLINKIAKEYQSFL